MPLIGARRALLQRPYIPPQNSLTWNPNSTQAALQSTSYTPTFSVTLDSTPSAGDVILIGVGNATGSNSPVSSVTVNGNAAAPVVGSMSPGTGYDKGSLWTISGITTTSLSIEVTGTGAFTYIGVAVGVLKGLSSSTPTATGYNNEVATSDPQVLTAAITVPASGVGIVFMGMARVTTPTSTNSTYDSTTLVTDSANFSLFFMHANAAGSWNPALSGTPTAIGYCQPGMVAAAWH